MDNNRNKELFIQLATELKSNTKQFIPRELAEKIKSTNLDPFISYEEKLYALKNTIYEKPKCIVCSGPVVIKNRYDGYYMHCSPKCVANNPQTKAKREATCLEKYGVTHTSKDPTIMAKRVLSSEMNGAAEKSRQTLFKNYGVTNIFQLESTKEKIRQTNLTRWGVENPQQNKEINLRVATIVKERYGGAFNPTKQKKTVLMRYGVENVLQHPKIKAKVAKTTIEKYGVAFNPIAKKQTSLVRWGVENAMQNSAIAARARVSNITTYNKEKLPLRLEEIYRGVNTVPLFTTWVGAAYHYEWQHETCGEIFKSNLTDGKLPRCPKCKPRSLPQQKMADFLFSLGVKVIENDRSVLRPKELDFWLPEFNIGIEVNGVYWHRDRFGPGIINKTNAMELIGNQLLHFWDIEITKNMPAVKNIILSKLKMHSRISVLECEIIEISSNKSQEFLSEWHLSGSANASFHFGMYHQSRLVGVGTFAKNRFLPETFEIIRFATVGVTIVGGLSKLIKFAQGKIGFLKLISLADRRISTGNSYAEFGCELEYITNPNYFYFKSGEKLNRQQLGKQKLTQLLGRTFNPVLSKEENMFLAGWIKCSDAGNLKFIKEF